MLVCEVGSGITARFWHDNWTSLGPLIELTGPRGPGTTGLHEDAVVAEALRDGEWWLSRSRSRNRLISMVRESLPDAAGIVASEVDDMYLWKPGNSVASSSFSAADTWEALHPAGEPVFWHRQVWFQGRIPKHAFITWVLARNRLGTRDRLRAWGLQVPATCVLCNTTDETMQHLFFDCTYSSEVWNEFVKLIVKLVYQAAVYTIWKERNARIHNNSFRQATVVIREIKQAVQARLDPLSRAHRSRRTDITLLGTWMSRFG
ncbi:uncharacterized protein LOC130510011 [Raphanus sativus]|uniref:Uncharacterized protein LOC130510011 n=1 Tax=Raphanus sativus TaxID=3726 RepID=A0A9W3DEQ8_RAPSA|nr:uncharacterized protein LOC130510011 [Raphanus sativus]